MRSRYVVHLPSLPLRDGDNLRSILVGAVLPTLHGHILCKTWYLCGMCWEDCERENSLFPTHQEAETTIAGLLKVDWGE